MTVDFVRLFGCSSLSSYKISIETVSSQSEPKPGPKRLHSQHSQLVTGCSQPRSPLRLGALRVSPNPGQRGRIHSSTETGSSQSEPKPGPKRLHSQLVTGCSQPRSPLRLGALRVSPNPGQRGCIHSSSLGVLSQDLH